MSENMFDFVCSFRQTQLHASGNFEDMTLPQAASEDEERAVGLQGAPDEVGQIGGSGFADELNGKTKPMDVSLLQMLSVSANLSLQEEEDTLGKVRGNRYPLPLKFIMWLCDVKFIYTIFMSNLLSF